jgi:hypothetical protein
VTVSVGALALTGGIALATQTVIGGGATIHGC